MAERLFVDISPQGTLVAPTAQARAALARRAGRWVLMPSSTSLLLLSQWEGPESPGLDGTERAVLLGEVGGLGLLDLLGLFSQTRRSARVVVSRGHTERAILLRDGEIASVASSDPRDKLGEFLCRIGKLTPAQLKDALDAAQQTGRKLGQHLVAGGILSSHELWGAIQQQIMEIICDVVGWHEGTYSVFSLPEGFTFPQTPPLATQAIILEAVRRSDEMALFRAKIPSYDTPLSATGKMPRDCAPTELAAIQAVRPGLTVRELGSRLQRSEFEVTKIVYQLVQKGALSVSEAAAAEAPAPRANTGTINVLGLAHTAQARPRGPEEVLQTFLRALREVHAECKQRGVVDAYRQGITAFLADPQNAYSSVFRGLRLLDTGEVDPAGIIANTSAAGGADPLRTIFDSMNELTFFALFQASELLDRSVDEQLASRVREILATLQG